MYTYVYVRTYVLNLGEREEGEKVYSFYRVANSDISLFFAGSEEDLPPSFHIALLLFRPCSVMKGGLARNKPGGAWYNSLT